MWNALNNVADAGKPVLNKERVSLLLFFAFGGLTDSDYCYADDRGCQRENWGLNSWWTMAAASGTEI